MEEKKLGLGWLIVAYVLLAACIGVGITLLIINASELEFGRIVIAVVEAIAALAAISYLAKGYKKDAAKYFKVSLLLFTSTFLLDYLCLALIPIKINYGDLDMNELYFGITMMLVSYGNYLLLSVAKDLGKVWSYVLLAVNFALNIVYLISVISIDSSNFADIWFPTEQCVMNLVFFIMVKAKYIDKSNRKGNL